MESQDQLASELDMSGTIGNCDAVQTAVLDKLRNHVRNELENAEERYDDWFLLRFCRARKFKYEDVVKMFDAYVNYRKVGDIDNVLNQECVFRFQEFSKENYPNGYCGVSRDGYPVYIEQYSKMDIDKIMKNFSVDELTTYYSYSYEMMIHAIFAECSKKAGRRIDKNITILDCKGLGVMRMMKSDTRNYLKVGSSLAQDNYPEMLGKLFLVNTGMTFSTLWAVAKLMVDEKTRKKIKVLGSKFEKDLHKYIDPSQLPLAYGGTIDKEVWDIRGPWSDYIDKCISEKSFFPDGVKSGDPFKEEARAAIGYKE